MKEKLLVLLGKLKELAAKAYAFSPLAVGIAIGYFGKPIITLALSIGAKLVSILAG